MIRASDQPMPDRCRSRKFGVECYQVDHLAVLTVAGLRSEAVRELDRNIAAQRPMQLVAQVANAQRQALDQEITLVHHRMASKP